VVAHRRHSSILLQAAVLIHLLIYSSILHLVQNTLSILLQAAGFIHLLTYSSILLQKVKTREYLLCQMIKTKGRTLKHMLKIRLSEGVKLKKKEKRLVKKHYS
jgi:hypothetical protein